MKLTLTVLELKKLVAEHFDISASDFELVIENMEDVVNPKLMLLAKIQNLAGANCENKLGAIKELRTQVPAYGLWEAKQVVENFPQVTKLLKATGKWPMPVRHPGNGELVVWGP